MQIRDDAAAKQFTADVPQGEAYLQYSLREDGTRDLQHTYVSRGQREKGIGGELVRYALEHAREQGYRVIPSCPFVRAWLVTHQEFEDVVVRPGG